MLTEVRLIRASSLALEVLYVLLSMLTRGATDLRGTPEVLSIAMSVQPHLLSQQVMQQTTSSGQLFLYTAQLM